MPASLKRYIVKHFAGFIAADRAVGERLIVDAEAAGDDICYHALRVQLEGRPLEHQTAVIIIGQGSFAGLVQQQHRLWRKPQGDGPAGRAAAGEIGRASCRERVSINV